MIDPPVILGLGTAGQTFQNLTRRDCVLNYASAPLWRHIERVAPLTGADPLPPHKRDRFAPGATKFGTAG